MLVIKRTKLDWDEETGVATCTLITNDSGVEVVETASCHPEDKDMMNEKTGLQIAQQRALIKFIKLARRETKTELNALEHLYTTVKQSKKFNPNSYENKMLQKRIKFLKEDYDEATQLIEIYRLNLVDFINDKEEFYKKTRARRKMKELEKKHESDATEE